MEKYAKSEFEKRKTSKPKEFDAFLKVVLVGQSGVGKSSIMLRFTDDKFNETYVNTIGVDFRFRTMKVGDEKVKIQIWDTAGQEKFRTMTSTFYRGADAIFLVYDITDSNSYDELMGYWAKEVEKQGQDCPFIVVVGNKSDLESKRKVKKPEEAKKKVKLGGIERVARTIETSAKLSDNVYEIFEELARENLKLKDIKKTTKDPNELAAKIKAIKTGDKEDGCSC